jgi:hypothetical protein
VGKDRVDLIRVGGGSIVAIFVALHAWLVAEAAIARKWILASGAASAEAVGRRHVLDSAEVP